MEFVFLRLRCILLVTGLLSPILPTQMLAGPDEITQPLINDTVSILDFGVFRLQSRIDSIDGLPLTLVGYDWEKNLITITGWVNEGERPNSDFQSICYDWFFRIRLQAGVDPSTGKLYEILRFSHFADLFSHFGFERSVSTKKPEEILVGLDEKFILELNWFGARGLPSDGIGATCSGPLIDNGFATKIDQGTHGTP